MCEQAFATTVLESGLGLKTGRLMKIQSGRSSLADAGRDKGSIRFDFVYECIWQLAIVAK